MIDGEMSLGHHPQLRAGLDLRQQKGLEVLRGLKGAELRDIKRSALPVFGSLKTPDDLIDAVLTYLDNKEFTVAGSSKLTKLLVCRYLIIVFFSVSGIKSTRKLSSVTFTTVKQIPFTAILAPLDKLLTNCLSVLIIRPFCDLLPTFPR